jgi:phosphoribosylformimino-5-aminoimidazole carboxamide ribonucleotide (ProFAR) isomerase
VQAVKQLEVYCAEFLYTHVDREGLMQGTDMKAILDVARATSRQVTAAGGITTEAEIEELDRHGIHAVVGMAIYTGLLAVKAPPSE